MSAASFFQDVSDPEYAQVQEALKNKLKVSANSNSRPTIYAVAVVEEPSASDKKPKQHARITSKGSLRLAHSAEDVSTLERISRRGERSYFLLWAGTLISWQVRSSLDRVVWVRALDVRLCSWERQGKTVPLSNQV